MFGRISTVKSVATNRNGFASRPNVQDTPVGGAIYPISHPRNNVIASKAQSAGKVLRQ
jgi:hypothetical protein